MSWIKKIFQHNIEKPLPGKEEKQHSIEESNEYPSEPLNEKEQLLSDFLQQVSSGQKDNRSTPAHQFSGDNFSSISLANYSGLEITPALADKIIALQKIAESIENKSAVKIDTKSLEKHYKINYAANLNSSQLAAVVTTTGPVLVIAGAGTGKTRIIVHRVSYLLEQGVPPQQILLLTFTRKAAREMLNRVQELHQDNLAEKVTGGTFHSFANMVLRRHSNMLGLPPDFTIIDTADAEDTVDLVRTELKFNKTNKAFPRKGRIYEIVSAARNRNLTIAQVIEEDFTGLTDFTGDIELIYKGYSEYKKISRVYDYDDLMEVLRNKLRDNQTFRQKLQQDYRYIMVDEFQDTNILQKEIVDFLAGGHRNVMVVGDDAQSIYAFRGANYENILRFPETYPDCRVIKIEQNYRSNQGLLDFTNSIISHAKIGYKKILFSQLKTPFRPIVKKLYNQEEEAEYIVSEILQLRERGINLKEIAVLTRAAWHWRYIELELRRRSIPYITVGGLAFNERMHIKDLIAYLRLLVNPYDAVAWHRVLKLLPGIGRVTSGNIVKAIRENNGRFDHSVFSGKKYFGDIVDLFTMLQQASDTKKSVASKIEIVKYYYAPILESREPDFNIRMLDIDVLCNLAASYEELEKFLSDFALEPPSKKFGDRTTPLLDESEEDPLTISTVHSAKGLEWHSVFIPHALDGLFPSVRAMHHIEALEEERRLFYVACSRAKERLYITMPSYVATYNGFCSYPARFLIEIDRNNYNYLS